MSFFDRPAGLAAACAFVVRLAVGLQGLSQNPLLTKPQLDSEYYVRWAREIASGDFTSAHGVVGPTPYILNPLYAFVLAPLAGAFHDAWIPTAVMAFQALLGAATAALAATAARRLFGRAAAWTAGLAVAFSTVLVQLDTHVAVSGVAAFLTAGAVFAAAPRADGSSGKGHGPIAKGLWLGVGALARPITPLALPFFAWDEFRRAASGRWKRVALLVAAFAACAMPSLWRNWSVGGEPVVYTAASGLNAHLGNNPEARKYRTMASPWVRFNPEKMHEDARIYVSLYTGKEPTPSQVSSYFTKMTIEELFRATGESIGFYLNKARWFVAPVEVPSSASLANDLAFAPLLRAAFVPTWLVAAAAFAGLFLHRRRRDVVCGPGALLFAHWAVLTLVFPLSHYRSPAIPALAVLAGGAVHASVVAWKNGAKRRVAAIVVGVAVVAAAGAIPPQPRSLHESDEMLLAIDRRDRKEWDAARAHAEAAVADFLRESPDERDFPQGRYLLGEIECSHGDADLKRGADDQAIAEFQRGAEDFTKVTELQKTNWQAWLMRSKARQSLGDLQGALADARAMERLFPWLGHVQRRLCEVLTQMGRNEEALDHYRKALDAGEDIDPEAKKALMEFAATIPR